MSPKFSSLGPDLVIFFTCFQFSLLRSKTEDFSAFTDDVKNASFEHFVREFESIHNIAHCTLMLSCSIFLNLSSNISHATCTPVTEPLICKVLKFVPGTKSFLSLTLILHPELT